MYVCMYIGSPLSFPIKFSHKETREREKETLLA